MTIAERIVTVSELIVHPEFEALIPALREEEFTMLEDSIMKEGVREPIIVWSDIIVDGHNRYKICQKHALPVPIREMRFASKEDAMAWMIENQLGRRNLTGEQYSYLRGTRYRLEKKAVGAPEGSINNPTGKVKETSEPNEVILSSLGSDKTAKKIASDAGVSERTVRRDEEFAKDIDSISQNTGITQQALLSKKMPVTKQIVKEIAKLPPSVQKKAMEKVQASKGIKSARDAIKVVKQDTKRAELIANASKAPVSTKQEIINSDFFEMSISPGKIDLFVTSPPYNLKKPYGENTDALSYDAYLEFTRRYLEKMFHGLADDGWLCLNIPLDTNKGDKHKAIYADITVFAQMVGFQYYSTIVWNEGHISSSTSFGSYNNVQGACVIAPVEVIVVFYKKSPQKLHDGVSTVTEAEFKEWSNGLWTFKGESGTRVGHPAPFPVELPDRLIKLFSYAGETVMDPFLGSGTTLVACVKNGRKGIGVEINKEFCDLASARVDAAERELQESSKV